MAKQIRKRKYRSPLFFRYLAYVLLFVSIVCLFVLFRMDIIPTKYYIVICVVVVPLVLLLMKILLNRGKLKRVVASLISFVLIIGMILISFYGNNTINFLQNNLGIMNSYKIHNYQVLVLNNSSYKDIDDIENKKIGTLENVNNEDEGLKEAIKKINKKIKVKYEEKDDAITLVNSLLDSDVDAILIEESQLALVTEEDNTITNKIRKIYSFEIRIKEENTTNDIDITKKPFNIYISGIDTYGSIQSVSRSDVNMVVSINPNTHNILLISIPRDYYVSLHGISSYKDKLTHAGMYGIDKSVQTIEDLLDTDINYYVKINFTSLIKIVDALGGVSVESESAFISKDGFKYTKGINYLNGEKALSFARERKAFADGDRRRGRDQQALLTALINKVTTPKIIVKYNSLLKSLDGSFVTNMSENNITKFIKMQINDNIKWNITSINLDGTNGMEYTYSYKSGKLYVMIPDLESVNSAKQSIKYNLNPPKENKKK
ncbi:MAG: LCP family protein [Bacilli bacterium]|nr:LCP family protein [Bacilli bacterium]